MDLESPTLEADLAAAWDGSSQVLLVGVHLCGMLSIYAARLFKKVPRPAALILAPCCLDKRLPGIKQRAKRLGVNPYTYWCLTLLMEEGTWNMDGVRTVSFREFRMVFLLFLSPFPFISFGAATQMLQKELPLCRRELLQDDDEHPCAMYYWF
eukprot:symbB.v1.2.012519.t1/scaffold867.1/size156651/5